VQKTLFKKDSRANSKAIAFRTSILLTNETNSAFLKEVKEHKCIDMQQNCKSGASVATNPDATWARFGTIRGEETCF
jgi:hypothetical protein